MVEYFDNTQSEIDTKLGATVEMHTKKKQFDVFLSYWRVSIEILLLQTYLSAKYGMFLRLVFAGIVCLSRGEWRNKIIAYDTLRRKENMLTLLRKLA